MDERVDRTRRAAEQSPLSRQAVPDPPVPDPPVRGRRGRFLPLLGGLILLLAAAGAGWYWWPHPAARPTPTATSQRGSTTPPQPVGAATVDTGDIRIILNALGTVTPLDTVTVMTQINGQLLAVGFQEGQVVKKGDFLAQIDPRPYQVALEQAQGTLAHDQGLLAQAQSDLKRYETLGRQDSIAQQQLSDQRFLVTQDSGTVQTDQGLVDSARLNLAYCHIVSPIDGQVGLRLVDPGNYVQTSGTTGIAVITQMQPISVLFAVPQDAVPAIIRRRRAGARLAVEAYDQANVTRLASGWLGPLDNQIDTTTGTLKLRALFANAEEALYPNQFVNVRLLVDTLAGVVRVPVPAVQRGAPGTYVYVITANHTVSVRPVQVGPTDGGYEAVVSGLAAGERVVIDGTDRLRDGAAVTVPAASGPAAGGADRGQAGPAAAGGADRGQAGEAGSSGPAASGQPGPRQHGPQRQPPPAAQ
jgi:multidrug efflux system membrane fusion protein